MRFFLAPTCHCPKTLSQSQSHLSIIFSFHFHFADSCNKVPATRDETMNPLSTPLLRGIPPAASKYLKVHLTHRKDPQFNCSREDGPHVNLGSIVCKFYLSFGFALKCDPTRELLNEASFSATKKAIWKNGPSMAKTEEGPTLKDYQEF